MRLASISAVLVSSLVVVSAQSYWRNIPPSLDTYRDNYRAFKQSQSQQAPMNPPGPAVPSESEKEPGNGDLTISDVLPRTRSINIFAGLTRDVQTVSGRLESTLPTDNTTLLAPLNSAMQNLPRKPWEDRPDDQSSVSAQSNENKAAENLKRFVLEHMVPVSPWEEKQKVKTLGGQEVWWEKRGGGEDGSQEKKVIMPGEVVVDGVVGRVGNGEIWSLKGVVNYQ